MKPILFNTKMVRALLDGRKTVTRRVVKPQPKKQLVPEPDGSYWHGYFSEAGTPRVVAPPYRQGDILYVLETWSKKVSDRCKGDKSGVCPFESCKTAQGPCFDEEYIYKATDNLPSYGSKWHPSTHIPKKAARLFLRVTDVRTERLQDMTGHDVLAEGVDNGSSNPTMGARWENMQRMAFEGLWNSTIKKADLPRYGWAANPWVWVIEFVRISKEEAYGTTD